SELIHACNAARFQDLSFRGVRPRERDVLFNGAVEQECVLQNHSELSPVRIEANGREVDSVNRHGTFRGRMQRSNQADDGRFAGTRRPYQSSNSPGIGTKTDVVQNLFALLIGESNILKLHGAVNGPNRQRALWIAIFGTLLEDLARTVQTCER